MSGIANMIDQTSVALDCLEADQVDVAAATDAVEKIRLGLYVSLIDASGADETLLAILSGMSVKAKVRVLENIAAMRARAEGDE